MKTKKKSTKGELIKGMSKKLPRSILEDPSFEQELKDLMKGYAGIYALYNKKELYYIGLATNLHWRISVHLKDRLRWKWDSFVIFRIKKVRYLKDIETLLLNIFETKGNKIKGQVPKDANISWILHDLARKKAKELEKIKKIL